MITFAKLSDWEIKALCKFTNSLTAKRWSKDGLVSLLNILTDDLGVVSVNTYAKKKNQSPQHARRKDIVRIDTLQAKILNY